MRYIRNGRYGRQADQRWRHTGAAGAASLVAIIAAGAAIAAPGFHATVVSLGWSASTAGQGSEPQLTAGTIEERTTRWVSVINCPLASAAIFEY